MYASPTKIFLMTHKVSHKKYFDYAFAARPEFELYELKRDPDQVLNVAQDPEYAKDLKALTKRLMNTLWKTVTHGLSAMAKLLRPNPMLIQLILHNGGGRKNSNFSHPPKRNSPFIFLLLTCLVSTSIQSVFGGDLKLPNPFASIPISPTFASPLWWMGRSRSYPASSTFQVIATW